MKLRIRGGRGVIPKINIEFMIFIPNINMTKKVNM